MHGRTVVVSNDAALRIKAAQLGLEAMEHQRLRGRAARRAPRRLDARSRSAAATIDLIYANPTRHRRSTSSTAPTPSCCGRSSPTATRCSAPAASRALVRHLDGELEPLQRVPEPWGLRPRSKEQQFALDLLLDPEVRVVALDGMAGTGKTILALAAGLEQVMETAPLRQGRRVPAGRPRRQGRARLPARARSTRSSTRG